MIDWNKGFVVIVICRYDLKQTGLADEQIAALSDEDMQVIAEQMGNFIEDSFFDEEVWRQVKQSALTRLEFGNMYGGTV